MIIAMVMIIIIITAHLPTYNLHLCILHSGTSILACTFEKRKKKKKEKTDEVVMQNQCEKKVSLDTLKKNEHSLSECGYCMHALRAYLHTHSAGLCLADD